MTMQRNDSITFKECSITLSKTMQRNECGKLLKNDSMTMLGNAEKCSITLSKTFGKMNAKKCRKIPR
jgi:hypothetical protein